MILSIDLWLRFWYSIITNQLKEGLNLTTAQILWLAAFVVFLAIEAGTITLVSIWFAAGALGGLIVSWAGGELWLQVTVFLAIACVTLACLRPLIRKFVSPKIVPTNTDSLIGTMAILSVDVDNLKGEGTVVLNGVEWTARSSNGEPIPAGTTVRVDRIAGVRAFVSPAAIKTKV